MFLVQSDPSTHGFDCVRSFLCQFFSMGVSSVFTLLLCGNTTFTLAVAFVSATMGLTTFSHRYQHPVCHRTICLLLSFPQDVEGSASEEFNGKNWLTRPGAASKPQQLINVRDDGRRAGDLDAAPKCHYQWGAISLSIAQRAIAATSVV